MQDSHGGGLEFTLEPGASFCLAGATATARPGRGQITAGPARWPRGRMARCATCCRLKRSPCSTGANWRARRSADPAGFLAVLRSTGDPQRVATTGSLSARLTRRTGNYPQVVYMDAAGSPAHHPVPPGHWLLLQEPRRSARR